jgi:hypothetical protein
MHLEGPAETINQVWENAKQVDGLLEAICPLGEWEYNKATSTWGTKWDVELTDLEYTETADGKTGTISGGFDSAWAPPTEAFESFLGNNPDCEAELLFFEGGNDFCGSLGSGEFTISDTGVSFFEQDPVGIQLDQTFGIVDMLHEHEDEVQNEILNEPLTLEDPEEGLVITKGTI